jgi:predicted RNA binding protein YcfA (HicA-like mRNA interferase family)
MPKKIRELKAMLRKAGWILIDGGKGSHAKYAHPKIARRITLAGQDGHDAKPYQERDVETGVSEAARARK